MSNALHTRLSQITSTLNDALSALTLNDLNEAVDGMWVIEHTLTKGQSMWAELEVDVDGHEILAEFHEGVTDTLSHFEDVIDEVNHDISEMIGKWWADEG